MSREPDLHPIEASHLHARRERVFIVFAGLFLGSLTMLNLLGLTRFLNFSFMGIPMKLAVGVLPYPITFLCTDFISEFYGRKRASFVVWVGFGLNLWVVFILWIGSELPPPVDESGVFYQINFLTRSAVVASMIAYLAAQFCDVYVFHFWKRLTKGRHLWLRNNGSTLVSQLVDSTAVIVITHYWALVTDMKPHPLPVDFDRRIGTQLVGLIAAGYVFKLVVALLDTVPFYLGSAFLARYLQIDPRAEHDADAEAGNDVPKK